MAARAQERLGGHILADQLKMQDVDTVFCVPGESFLGLLDGLYNHRNAIRTIATRHEAGAANMAEAYAKLTGKPGIVAVTRGPGATNASNGIHTAFQDSTPMIVLIGQVGRAMTDREAFQEIDYRRMFGEMAKWVAQIDDPARIPEYISQAFHVAQSGRPGPVVLALPEDVLSMPAIAEDVAAARPVQAAPNPADMGTFRDLLTAAERPVLIVGGPTWTAEAAAGITRFAETYGLPVAAAFRYQDIVDNRHPNYAGVVGIGIDPKLRQRIITSDLVIALGPRLGEITTQGYTLFHIPEPAQTLVHVHPGAEELGRVYRPHLAVNAAMPAFVDAALALHPLDGSLWQDQVADANRDYLAYIEPTEVPGPLNPGRIMADLSRDLPEDAIITNGAGNYTVFVHRFFQYKVFGSQLAPTSGSMGYGVPAAIAAKIAEPQRMVISVNGDGCFMMLGQELATAMQYGAPVIFLVVNNGLYGTIRMHQERAYPGRAIATDLQNPDFAALARAYGAHGETVTATEDFKDAFDRAVESGKPALLDLVIDPEALTPGQTLSEIREGAR